jgi:hypothetical protein
MKTLSMLISKRAACLMVALAATLLPMRAHAVNILPYAWEFPRVTAITTAADTMKAELSEEIQKVLDAGPLAPLYISYGDGSSRGYTVYQEPGRIITTLAWAYPHLPPAQQAAVRLYVQSLLTSPVHAPWAPYPLPKNAGTARELHPKTHWWFENPHFGANRPRVQVLYGVWLWAYRAGDWTSVLPHWNTIKDMYNNLTDQADLYGTMCAHIAMARMAAHFGDSAMQTQALNALQSMLDSGVNFNTVDNRAWNKTPYWISPYRDEYDDYTWQTLYLGWIFLNLSPEMGRYLRDHVLTATLTRHQNGKRLYPNWWLGKANYFVRGWTGDEGTGLTPEIMGMMFPIERWVIGADAQTLAGYMRSCPTGVGDCHWIESLVQAIEAFGVTTWTDVRAAAGVEQWAVY